MQSDASARVSKLLEEAMRSGTPDWASLEHTLGSNEDKEILNNLRRLRGLAAFHADLQDGDRESSASDESAPAVAPGGRASSPAVVLRTWGKLKILALQGSGAFGDVYAALDPDLDRKVALKLFRARVSGASHASLRTASTPDRRAMVQEARHMARVRHPNVVVIHGADEIGGEVGIWMDLIRGQTLGDLFASLGRFSAQEAALIGLDLCRALAAVHSCGLVHRDIKPQNVMREEGGRIVLMDFGVGIALPRGASRAVDLPSGTPLYMAPESLLKGSVSSSSDQYSLGVLLFHLVTGEYPVKAVSMDELLARHRNGSRRALQDARLDLPLAFAEAVERALSPAPEDRFGGMGEMERVLASVLLAESTGPGEAGRTAQRWVGGRTLGELLAKRGAFGPQEAALVGLALSRQLGWLHARGQSCGRIRPRDVTREEGGRIHLVPPGMDLPDSSDEDRASEDHLHLAPEALLFRDLGPAADQYSLAVILFHLVTALYPVSGSTVRELRESHRAGRRLFLRDLRPDLPLPFVDLVEQGLAEASGSRFPDIGEMEQALMGILGAGRTSRPIAVPLVPETPPPARPGRRGPILRTSALAILLLVLLLVLGPALMRASHRRASPVLKQVTRSGRVRAAELSPDGRAICFAADNGNQTWSLRCLSLEDSTSSTLGTFTDATGLGGIRWCPDGGRVFVSLHSGVSGSWNSAPGSGVFAFPIDGGSPARVADECGLFAPSPDGGSLLAAGVSWAGEYEIRDLVSGSVTKRKIPARDGHLRGVDWGGTEGQCLFLEEDPTGASVICICDPGLSRFSSSRPEPGGAFLELARFCPTTPALYVLRRGSDVAVADLARVPIRASSQPQKFRTLLRGVHPVCFSVSSDGRRVALLCGQQQTDLRRLSRSDSGTLVAEWARSFGQRDFDQVISADGRTIALTRALDGGRTQIYTMPTSGGEATQVTHEAAGAFCPAWAPRGQHLAYLVPCGMTATVCIIRLDGQERRVLKKTNAGRQLVWSRRGEILYQVPDETNFEILDPDSEGERPLVTESRGPMFGSCMSPDGKRVAVVWNRPPQGLWIIDPWEDSDPVLLTASLDRSMEPIGWSADGRWIWAVEKEAEEATIVRISTESGTREPMYSLALSGSESRVAIAPDDSFFLVSMESDMKDIWLMDAFDPEVR